MREILFRGKRKDNGEWVEGYYCRFGWTGQEKSYIIPSYASACTQIEVDPSTVGQYTGRDAYLKSKDIIWCKLFEGDICEVTVFDHNGIDAQHICTIEYLGGSFCFVGNGNYDFLLPLNDVDDTESDVEVIGTIHDKEGET